MFKLILLSALLALGAAERLETSSGIAPSNSKPRHHHQMFEFGHGGRMDEHRDDRKEVDSDDGKKADRHDGPPPVKRPKKIPEFRTVAKPKVKSAAPPKRHLHKTPEGRLEAFHLQSAGIRMLIAKLNDKVKRIAVVDCIIDALNAGKRTSRSCVTKALFPNGTASAPIAKDDSKDKKVPFMIRKDDSMAKKDMVKKEDSMVKKDHSKVKKDDFMVKKDDSIVKEDDSTVRKDASMDNKDDSKDSNVDSLAPKDHHNTHVKVHVTKETKDEQKHHVEVQVANSPDIRARFMRLRKPMPSSTTAADTSSLSYTDKGPVASLVPTKQTCKANETFVECGTACPETCDGQPMMCTMQCVIGCACKSDMTNGVHMQYVRHNGQCILKTDCPGAGSSTTAIPETAGNETPASTSADNAHVGRPPMLAIEPPPTSWTKAAPDIRARFMRLRKPMPMAYMRKDDSTDSKDDSMVNKDDSTDNKDDSTDNKDDSTDSKDDSTDSKDDSTDSKDDSMDKKVDSMAPNDQHKTHVEVHVTKGTNDQRKTHVEVHVAKPGGNHARFMRLRKPMPSTYMRQDDSMYSKDDSMDNKDDSTDNKVDSMAQKDQLRSHVEVHVTKTGGDRAHFMRLRKPMPSAYMHQVDSTDSKVDSMDSKDDSMAPKDQRKTHVEVHISKTIGDSLSPGVQRKTHVEVHINKATDEHEEKSMVHDNDNIVRNDDNMARDDDNMARDDDNTARDDDNTARDDDKMSRDDGAMLRKGDYVVPMSWRRDRVEARVPNY